MNLSLIILLVILSLFLLGFIYIEPILMKHKVKNDNEYGSARFSTDNEIKKKKLVILKRQDFLSLLVRI